MRHEQRLIILGHGSSKHPESSVSVRKHAGLLRSLGGFSKVDVAFLKEDPLLDHCLDEVGNGRVLIVPDFLAEGYFTRQVIPAKLDLLGRDNVCYCPPVGTHPLMAELIIDFAQEVMGEWDSAQTSLFVIGHGSGRNPCSKQTLLHHLAVVRESGEWPQVADLWLEEYPFVRDWHEIAEYENVIIVPYLLNDGQHGGWDIPADLGVEKGASVHGVTHRLNGRNVRIAPALGTSSRFAEAIAAIAKIWGEG